MTTAIERTLTDFFEEEQSVRLAFLMGSFAKETARPDSDVDVAALFDRTPDFMETLDLRERLSALLRRETDLVVLNDAGPIIGMQAL
ncbi:MAG: nucleotidyltransferase domain-containing protein, partial [Synergistaceae bacterium]|nr:nucleotidyltransferase domain-containing protein [Synergistaceae bacterium]